VRESPIVGDQVNCSDLRSSRPLTRVPTPQSCTRMASSRSQGDLCRTNSSNFNTPRRYNLSETTPKRATPRLNASRTTSERTGIPYNNNTPSDINNPGQPLKHVASCPDHIPLHDWKCNKCTVKNDGGDRCNMCGEPRPSMQRRLTRTTLGQIESSELQSNAPSWNCPSCQVTNSNRSDKCTLCGRERSSLITSSSSSDWYCNRCSTCNHFTSIKCNKCNNPKPNNPNTLNRLRSVSSPVPNSAPCPPSTRRTNLSGSNPPQPPSQGTVSRTPTPRGLNCNVAVEPNINRTTMKRKIVPINEANIQLKYT